MGDPLHSAADGGRGRARGEVHPPLAGARIAHDGMWSEHEANDSGGQLGGVLLA